MPAAEHTDPPPAAPPGTRAVVDVRCSPSEDLAAVIESLGGSVVLTAPHTGNLIVLAERQNRARGEQDDELGTRATRQRNQSAGGPKPYRNDCICLARTDPRRQRKTGQSRSCG